MVTLLPYSNLSLWEGSDEAFFFNYLYEGTLEAEKQNDAVRRGGTAYNLNNRELRVAVSLSQGYIASSWPAIDAYHNHTVRSC